MLETFIEAAVQAGILHTSDFNRGDNFDVGHLEVNQKRGIRWNTAKGFLRPASQRPNLTIVTGVQVRALTFDGKRCTGVTYRRTGQDYTVAAREEVILSAGAINSPQLLELTGIGQPERLQTFGIPVRQALPGVGKSLQDHL